MEKIKLSLCCGAYVGENIPSECMNFSYRFRYRCLACNDSCALQKNENLTLAEVYAVIDDVNEIMDEETGNKYSGSSLKLDWPNEYWLNKKFTITDRKSWHSKLDVDDVMRYLGSGGFVKNDAGVVFRKREDFVEYYHGGGEWYIFCACSTKYWFPRTSAYFTCEDPEKTNKKEIKIGDVLTSEQAIKYVRQDGGFVLNDGNIYRIRCGLLRLEELLEYFSHSEGKWKLSSFESIDKVMSSTRSRRVACENPEKTNKKEIKIGDVLTQEQAQKYIENGGFVSLECDLWPKEATVVYRWNKILEVKSRYDIRSGLIKSKYAPWSSSKYTNISGAILKRLSRNSTRNVYTLTAIENPDTEKSEDKTETSSVKKLKEELESARKLNDEYRERLSKAEHTKKCLQEIIDSTEPLEVELANWKKMYTEACKEIPDIRKQVIELQNKLTWLPFPENTPKEHSWYLTQMNRALNKYVVALFCYGSFRYNGFDITSEVKSFREI